jgi:WD40 repeat protein
MSPSPRAVAIAGRRCLELLHGALRLSAHVVAEDPAQLAGQLCGRLRSFSDEPQIAQLLEDAAAGDAPRLLPLLPTLSAPGGPLLRTLPGHRGGVRGLAALRGATLASIGDDGALRVWDMARGDELRAIDMESIRLSTTMGLGPEGPLTRAARPASIVALGGGDSVAIGFDDDHDTVVVLNCDTERATATLAGHPDSRPPFDRRGVESVAVSPGNRLLLAGAPGGIRGWDLDTARQAAVFDFAGKLAVSPDGSSVLSGGGRRQVVLWRLADGGLIRPLGGAPAARGGSGPALVTAVAMTPDGRRGIGAFGDEHDTVVVWDLADGEILRTLVGHPEDRGALEPGGTTSLAVTPDGEEVLAASSDGTLRLWSLRREDAAVLPVPGGTISAVTSLAIAGDGRFAAGGSADGSIHVWEIGAAVQAGAIADGPAWGDLSAADLTPDARRAIFGSLTGRLEVWDAVTGRRMLRDEGLPVWDVAITPDGRIVACACDALEIWDVDHGRLVNTLEGDRVRSVALSSDGRLAVTGDVTVAWDLDRGGSVPPPATPPGRPLAVADDGALAAVHASGALHVVDVRRGVAVSSLAATELGWSNRPEAIAGVAAALPVRRAVSISHDGGLAVWDLEASRCLVRGTAEIAATRHGKPRNEDDERFPAGWRLGSVHAAMTPDGSRAVIGASDGTVELWDLLTARPLACFRAEHPVVVCAIAPDGRTISAADASRRVHLLRLSGRSALTSG